MTTHMKGREPDDLIIQHNSTAYSQAYR